MVRKFWFLFLIILISLNLTGCFKTYTYQAERKDQALTGNRGIIVGTPPAEVRTGTPTRTMMAADIELETTSEMVKNLKSKKTKKASAVSGSSFEEASLPEEASYENPATIGAIEEFDTYKVKKNDTLQKISQQFYGTTKNWKKIYNANKDRLKSPDKIRPGMDLKVPRLKNSKSHTPVKLEEKGIK